MSYFTTRSRRIVAGTLAGALALSVTPIVGFLGTAGAADALPPVAEPIGAGNFCENGPTTEPFTDVSDADPSHDEIACLNGTGLTTGVTATTYGPNASITRRQMALFIKRLADLANAEDTGTNIAPLPAYDGVPDYTDVIPESTAVKEAVGQLTQAGIVGGFPDDTYRPAALVSRRQMAAFINRLQDFLSGDPYTTTGDFFNDDNGDSGEDNLNALASVGIFQGDGEGNVFPGANLTRRQMANILLRHAQVMLDAGDIDGPFEPSTNQSFTANQALVNRQLTGTNGSGTGGVIEYTFSGLDPARDYDVALLQCGADDEGPDVLLDGGLASFADQDFDNEADQVGNTMENDAVIATVGFTLVNSDYADDVSPEANGSLLIRLDSDSSDCAYVVVWDDDLDDDDIDLAVATRDSYNTATDKFGVTGPAVWDFGEAPTGTDPSDDVVYVDKEANFFILADGYRYNYDAADTGHYCGSEVDYALTMQQFEDALSIGDLLDSTCDIDTGNYSRTNANKFQIDDDTVNRPSNVVLTAIDLPAGVDADTDIDDFSVTWTAPSPLNGDVDEYCVDIYNASTFAFEGSACTDEVNTAGTGDAPTSLVIRSQAAGTGTPIAPGGAVDYPGGSHFAVVYSDSETDDGSYYSQKSNVATTGLPADTVRPTITDARVTTDALLQDRVDAGDVYKLTFSEDMSDTLDVDAIFALTDNNGDTFSLDCSNAASATCVLSDDGANVDRILTITVVAASDLNVGGDGVLNIPFSISTTNALVTDEAGNVVNLATSADVLVDKEV